MPSVSALGGLSTALFSTLSAPRFDPPEQKVQPGPPDHAKAWGWRAKQAAEAPPAAEAPSETPETAKVDALLTGGFGEISIKIENAAGEFKFEVSRDEDGLSVEFKAETDHGEIKIAFESGEHGGLAVKFEMGEAGEISLFVSNLDDSDAETAVELLTDTPPEESASAFAETSGADMETVVLNSTVGATAPTASGAMSEYEKMQALFS